VLARIVALTLRIGVAEGMRRDALVEAAGLQEIDLGDPDARVPLSTQVALLQLVAKFAPDPGAGTRESGCRRRYWRACSSRSIRRRDLLKPRASARVRSDERGRAGWVRAGGERAGRRNGVQRLSAPGD